MIFVVRGTDIKKCVDLQLVDMSCCGSPGLGPNKMNLCLNIQTARLCPSWYLDQCSLRSHQLATICKIRNMKILVYFCLNGDKLFNFFSFNICFKCWAATGLHAFFLFKHSSCPNHHFIIILLQLWINLKGLEHLYQTNLRCDIYWLINKITSNNNCFIFCHFLIFLVNAEAPLVALFILFNNQQLSHLKCSWIKMLWSLKIDSQK